MARSVLLGGGGAPPSHNSDCRRLLLRPSAVAPQTSLKLSAVKAAAAAAPPTIHFRFNKNVLGLKIKETRHAVSASNSNPPDGDSTKDKSGGVETNDAAAASQGPPLLTILAGFLVLFLVFWVLGSILMWVISLLFRLPPSK